MKLTSLYVLFFAGVVFFLNGCAGPNSDGGVSLAPERVKALSDFPDHVFDTKAYLLGMSGDDNLMVWQDPAIDFDSYQSVSLGEFTDRLLPPQSKFSYEPYIQSFLAVFRDSLDVKADGLLRIEGALVECNPGSRVARYLIGMGAGKASVAAVVEVFEPGKSRPSLRLYSRDTVSLGSFGGDSGGMLDHLITGIAARMLSDLEERIDLP